MSDAFRAGPVAGLLAKPPVRAGIALAVTVLGAWGATKAFGPALYSWLKAIHIIAVMSWMAGMLYLPRLFVYHCEAEKGSQQSETFKVMERRLLRAIMNPAMIVTWVVGLWLVWTGGWFFSAWFHVKLLAVFALSAAHGYFSAAVRAFAEDRNTRDHKHWRIMNEVPTVLMIVIVVLVVVKPW
jgi:protoporphyrinogen IX oxidase